MFLQNPAVCFFFNRKLILPDINVIIFDASNAVTIYRLLLLRYCWKHLYLLLILLSFQNNHLYYFICDKLNDNNNFTCDIYNKILCIRVKNDPFKFLLKFCVEFLVHPSVNLT